MRRYAHQRCTFFQAIVNYHRACADFNIIGNTDITDNRRTKSNFDIVSDLRSTVRLPVVTDTVIAVQTAVFAKMRAAVDNYAAVMINNCAGSKRPRLDVKSELVAETVFL